MFQQKGKQVISGPDEEGKNETVVKVSEKLRSGPLIQGFPMLYRVLPKSKEEIKETHYQHNSCQNCQNNSLKVLGWRGQGILLDNVQIEPGGTKCLLKKTKIGLCQYQFIGVKQECRYCAYRRDAKQKHADVDSRLGHIQACKSVVLEPEERSEQGELTAGIIKSISHRLKLNYGWQQY